MDGDNILTVITFLFSFCIIKSVNKIRLRQMIASGVIIRILLIIHANVQYLLESCIDGKKVRTLILCSKAMSK